MPLLIVLLLTLVPTAAGVAAVRLARRASTGRLIAFAAALTAALVVFGVCFALRVGVWDALWCSACVMISGHAAAVQMGRRGIAVAAVSLVVGVIVMEIGARLLLPSPPRFPPIHSASVRLPAFDFAQLAPTRGNYSFSAFHTVDACGNLHPESHPPFAQERLAGRSPSANGAVLHVGDSMTFGQGVERSETYQAHLEQATGVAQINAAMPATSVDYHLPTASHWLKQLSGAGWNVRLLVVGLYFNDPFEIDTPLDCCPDGRLVAYRGSTAADACPAPAWKPGFGTSMGWFLSASPLPYTLRAGTEFSVAAAHLAGRAAETLQRTFGNRVYDGGIAYAHFLASIRGLSALAKERGIPLALVLQPTRWAFEELGKRGTEAREMNDRIRASLAEMGVTLLDPEERFRTLVADGGVERWFLPNGDIHLNPQGNAELAKWLEPELTALLAKASDGAAAQQSEQQRAPPEAAVGGQPLAK